MGVSTDGILFYGFCWDEEKELLPDGEDGRNQSEWQSIILAKRGVPDPWEAYPACDGLEYAEKRRIQNAWVQDNDAAIKARWAAKATINDEFGCDIGRHCSDGCSMPYVYAMESRVVASRGCPENVTTDSPCVGEWDALLAKFMTELGIERPHPLPRWWLASYWG